MTLVPSMCEPPAEQRRTAQPTPCQHCENGIVYVEAWDGYAAYRCTYCNNTAPTTER